MSMEKTMAETKDGEREMCWVLMLVGEKAAVKGVQKGKRMAGSLAAAMVGLKVG